MESECDTPARWLVHYIAENIHKSETSEGEERNKAEKNCVDAILKLWHHRSDLPKGIKPFADFDSVFKGLSRLSSSGFNHYYNEFLQFEHEIDDEESHETKQWVGIAIDIDKAAKELVSDSFELAAQAALTEKSRNILQQTPEVLGDDIKIMLSFLDGVDKSKDKARELVKIKSKIEKIESLKAICDVFIASYKNDLAAVEAKEI
ncbi:hypothetical protein [Vibrio crassostreae]|uniref:hypothetical protein n=1 Tax=Vibrio crassostreae TaxID=246167 RepID=UPI001FEE5AD5|nr:hypothetical protein [Vibrio crassostreae]